jgi:hypothetical protein
MSSSNWAAELFPQHTKNSGAAAVIQAAEDITAEHLRLVDQNVELRCRIEELESALEAARTENERLRVQRDY